MRISTRIYILLSLFVSVLLSSCGEYNRLQKTSDYEYKYEAAKAYFMEGRYTRASQLFGDLLASLKGTAYGEESLYLLAMSNYNAKDYESASAYFRKYYQSYPKGIYVEYARYYSGLSLYHETPDPRLDQSNTMEAINELQNFLDLYP
ncbi:MAG: outer membrane protein assembly factor BamD, partial [Bacteroidaceae bacterium]|nr:outer membrane protein assembly factor BamD [Bacteroidaceae bacterium]